MADINIGQFSEALNDKMDIDSGNANPAVAKQSDLATLQAAVTELQEKINNMLGRFDYANITTGTIDKNTPFTAPKAGYIQLSGGGNYFYIKVNGVTLTSRLGSIPTDSNNVFPTIGSHNLLNISAGDIVSLQADSGSPSVNYTFIPQKS